MASTRMQFILEGRDNLTRVLDRAGDASDKLARKLLLLGAVGGSAPIGAAILAGTGALVAGFASAGLAAGAFGAAVQPQIKLMTDNAAAAKKLATAQEDAARKKQVASELEAKGSNLAKKAQSAYTSARLKAVDAEKAYQRQTKGLPKATADAALSLAKLKTAQQQWSASLAKDTMPIFTKGLDMARKALPYLTPLVETASTALSGFMDNLGGGSDGMKRFLDRINEAAKKTLPDLLNAGKNVFIGLGGIISAFLPTSDKMTGGLAKGAEAFAKWGQGLGNSDGFKKFMDIASTGAGSLGNLALAALDLYDALRPILGTTIKISEGFAKFIRWLPPGVLAAIATGLIGIKLATMGISLALAILDVNPLVLAAAAGAALGLALVVAWKKSQTFREIVTFAFQSVAQIALSQLKVILLGLRAFTDTTITTASAVAGTLASAFGWVPGVGPKLKAAAKFVDQFRTDTNKSFDDAAHKIDAYSRAANGVPKVKFQGDSSPLKSEITAAQGELDRLKQRQKVAVGAEKAQLDAEVTRAQAQLDSLKQRRAATIAASDQASGKISLVQRLLNQVNGRVATAIVRTQYERVDSQNAPAFRARGGPIGLAGGGSPSGMVRGPGTGTSDSIPALLSNGEYVINARSTGKYRSLIEAINGDRLGGSGGMGGAGAAVAQGLAAGMDGSGGSITAAARRMASMVTLGIKSELQIASPSKKTKALAYDVARGFLEGLTGSSSKIKSASADLVKDIKTAFSGRKESGLVNMVNKDTRKLLDLAAKRDALAAKIAEAKSYASDLTKNAREGATLSNLGLQPEEVSAGSIKAGLAGKLAQIQQFSRYIGILAKRGLNKGLLRQILNMGPDAGYAYASALAGADKSTLAAVNKTQTAIDKATTSLGRQGADILYDAGKNAGKGFLKGLEGQQKDIENLMLKIAKGMQKAIKKALGIRSPSTVMAQLGNYSTQGLARGLVAGMPVLDQALAAVSGRVAGTQPVMGQPAVAAAGARPVNVQIDVHGAMDPVSVGREIRRMLLELKRVHGLNVNLGVA